MISDDHKHTIGLMQQQQKQKPTSSSSSSSSVNHLQSSSFTIYDNNHHLQLTQKKSIPSSRIRLGLRCLSSLDDKQKQLFDQIFSYNEQTANIGESIFNQYISRITTIYNNTLILLTGQYCEISQIQSTLLSLTLNHLYYFVNEQNKDLSLQINIQEFSSELTTRSNILTLQGKSLLSTSDYTVTCPIQTFHYINHICSNHKSFPLLITFHLINRLSNLELVQLHILSTNDNDDETAKTNNSQEEFTNLLMSLSLSLPSNRQKQSYHLSNKRNTHEQSSFSFTSILNQYVINNIDGHFLYILATIKNDKQLKYWTKIQRLLETKHNRIKMSRDSTSIETVINRPNGEIWVDGPLSSSIHKNEIWIDGPREFLPRSPKISHLKLTPKHRSKPMYTKPKHPNVLSPKHTLSLYAQHDIDETESINAFETESIVSSHCHVPVLPVFKDHSLLPFRPNPIPSITKPIVSESSKINLQLSRDRLNDDLELLEKTLETLLVPSPIVPNKIDNESTMSQSINRMDQLSSKMSHDEKNKRLSRIVSPTRFDKILSSENHPPSVPSSPYIASKIRHSRTPNHVLQSPKKPQIPVRTTSLSETNSRPSIFQRLFGVRSSLSNPQQNMVIQSPPSSPLISPLTVTLDSHDDLMPLTTSSTASSASGRASSSGYESMSNTILEEMIASIPSNITNGTNSIKTRSKSSRKDRRMNNNNELWNSPTEIHDKSSRHQRLSELKHRQNELKLELAMTKAFLLMDKNKTLDQNDSFNLTMNNSPLHAVISTNFDEEKELEKDIEYLEKRLSTAKSQLLFHAYHKNKQFKS